MGNSIMGHFARVDDGIVTEVIVAQSSESCEATYGGTWIQTSYNTQGNLYMIEGETEEVQEENPDWVDPGYFKISSIPRYIVTTIPKRPLHKNFASVGYTWDGIGFAAPKPFNSWTLNEDTYQWEAPEPIPTDDKKYIWNENHKEWEEVV